MKLFWMILAGACIVAAALFLATGRLDTAFVIAVVGLIAWFLNYRAQMKEIVALADRQDDANESGEIDEEVNGE